MHSCLLGCCFVLLVLLLAACWASFYSYIFDFRFCFLIWNTGVVPIYTRGPGGSPAVSSLQNERMASCGGQGDTGAASSGAPGVSGASPPGDAEMTVGATRTAFASAEKSKDILQEAAAADGSSGSGSESKMADEFKSSHSNGGREQINEVGSDENESTRFSPPAVLDDSEREHTMVPGGGRQHHRSRERAARGQHLQRAYAEGRGAPAASGVGVRILGSKPA